MAKASRKRLPEGERRSANIKFRATEGQKKHIQQLAAQCGMTVSDYVLARACDYRPKARATGLDETLCRELLLVRSDYKKYIGMLTGMDPEARRQMFSNQTWMAGALKLLDIQRTAIDNIINNVFGKNPLPPGT